ncbi:MAG: glutamyl-tRNA reductase [Halobellus sp.]|uniref:glutamyl-tRNA reductase n=1 Tax=Halobellus sp. TaxID=1979212 RepID=UPI0035D489FC
MDTGVICGARVSHRLATVDEIEAAAGSDTRTVIEELLASDGVTEAFAIQTCNRAEAYVVAASRAEARRALSSFGAEVDDSVVVEMGHEESLRHLMRVATGLESLVLGEDQILGQFKRAVEVARSAGALGSTLETGLTKAVHVGERARTETRVNEGAISIGSAAARLAETEIDLVGTTALVVGAGEMGELAAEALADAGVGELLVANRTLARAERLVESVAVDAQAIPLESVKDMLASASVVVTATSYSEYLLLPDDVDGAGETLVIDLAQPRDVDPEAGTVDQIAVHDIDALESVTEATKEVRERAAEEVEAMIDTEFDRLLDAYKRRQADEAISTMYEAAEQVKAREVETAISRLESQGDLTDEQRETIESMADALVGQLLSAPTKSLREAAVEDDWSTIQTAMTLFDPNFSGRSRGPGRAPRSNDDVEAIPEEAVDGIPNYVLESVSDD